jgi:flavin-binding protein dodecin
MADNVYKTVEIVGTSTVDVNDAMKTAVAKASQSLRNLDWFELVEVRGNLDNGEIKQFQVTMKVGFRLE